MKRLYGTLVSFLALQGLAVASQPLEEIPTASNADRLTMIHEINADPHRALILWLENHTPQEITPPSHIRQKRLADIKKLSELVELIIKQKTIEHPAIDPDYLLNQKGLMNNLADIGILSFNNHVLAQISLRDKRKQGFFIYQPKSHGPIINYSKDDLFLRGFATLVKLTFETIEPKDFINLENYHGIIDRLNHLTSYFVTGDRYFKSYSQFMSLRKYNNSLLDFLMANEWHMRNFSNAAKKLSSEGAIASPEVLNAYANASAQKNALSRQFMDKSKELSLIIQDQFLSNGE